MASSSVCAAVGIKSAEAYEKPNDSRNTECKYTLYVIRNLIYVHYENMALLLKEFNIFKRCHHWRLIISTCVIMKCVDLSKT